MLSNNILFVLAITSTFLISVHCQSPHVSLSSYQYEPNSIPQNEKILQLFLRLASHTASRLLSLKQKNLDEQLQHLKENKNLDQASNSESHIKNMFESYLRGNNFKELSTSDEINSASREGPEDGSVEIQNRLMMDYDKENISQGTGQNVQNSGQASQTNSVVDPGSNLFNLQSSSNVAAASINQQNSNPNTYPIPNLITNHNLNSNPNPNSNILNLSGPIQDAGSKISSLMNPATFTSNLGTMIPLNMISNVPVIGSGISGPINIAQEAASRIGSFAPQLRSFPILENGINAPDGKILTDENSINETSHQKSSNGTSQDDPIVISSDESSQKNVSVTGEVSPKEQNQTNVAEPVTIKSEESMDNETTTKINNLDELSFNETKYDQSEQNSTASNPAKEEDQKGNKIDDKKKVEKIKLPKENLETSKEKKQAVQDPKVKLQILTNQVMMALQQMQEEISGHKESDGTLLEKSPHLPTNHPASTLDGSALRLKSRSIKASYPPLPDRFYYNHAPIRNIYYPNGSDRS